MDKYISLCDWEEVVEYDETMTYKNFLMAIVEKFKLRENSFCVKGVDKNNFYDVILLKNSFEIERTEKDVALERLNGKNHFRNITTIEETEAFLTVYGFKGDRYKRTPLYWAVDRNRIEIVEFLLEKDFDNAHQADEYEETPLSLAVYNGYKNIVELLLEEDFDNAHQADKDGETPLFWAADRGYKDIVELLLEKDFDNAHQADKDDQTPLFWAADRGYKDIVELLLAKDFDNAHQADKDGETPLSRAVFDGNIEIIDLITEDIERRRLE